MKDFEIIVPRGAHSLMWPFSQAINTDLLLGRHMLDSAVDGPSDPASGSDTKFKFQFLGCSFFEGRGDR